MRKSWLLIGVALLAAALAIGAVACEEEDEDGEEPTATEAVETPVGETPQAGVVNVNLTEWRVAPDPASVAAGTGTFNARNIGGVEHELVVIKTDLAPDALPTKSDGSADDEGAGIEIIGRIDKFAPGGEESDTFDLQAGSYVLICNVVDDSGSHYDLGMRTGFTVAE